MNLRTMLFQNDRSKENYTAGSLARMKYSRLRASRLLFARSGPTCAYFYSLCIFIISVIVIAYQYRNAIRVSNFTIRRGLLRTIIKYNGPRTTCISSLHFQTTVHRRQEYAVSKPIRSYATHLPNEQSPVAKRKAHATTLYGLSSCNPEIVISIGAIIVIREAAIKKKNSSIAHVCFNCIFFSFSALLRAKCRFSGEKSRIRDQQCESTDRSSYSLVAY